MRLHCTLRVLRGKRSLRDMQLATGISGGELSRIERGILLPADTQVAALEHAYGAPSHEWYHPQALLVIQADDETA